MLYSLSLPNIYQSKALLSPVGEQVSSNQSMNNLGGLASLAGFEVSNQGGGNSAKAMEKLRTLSFFQDNIMPNIFLPGIDFNFNFFEPITLLFLSIKLISNFAVSCSFETSKERKL